MAEYLGGDSVSDAEAAQLIGALGALISADEDVKMLARTLEISTAKYVNMITENVAQAARELNEILYSSAS